MNPKKAFRNTAIAVLFILSVMLLATVYLIWAVNNVH